jgi:hypothetical protein
VAEVDVFVAEPAVVFQKKVPMERPAEFRTGDGFKLGIRLKPTPVLLWVEQPRKVIPDAADRLARKERKAAYRERADEDQRVRVAFFKEQRDKAVADFELHFDWEDRKVMAAAAYWTEAVNFAPANQTTVGAVGAATDAAALAARVSSTTSEQWMIDWHNNEGYFSASLWGANTKTASILGDVESRQ